MVTLSPTGASVPTTLNRFFEKLSSQQTPRPHLVLGKRRAH